MKRAAAILALPLLLNPAAAQNTVPADVSSANIHAHMAFLASDRLRGREAGTAEYDLAANYVAAQMKGLGLSPMGGKGAFFQHVPLVAYRTTDQGKLTLRGKDGRATPLVFGKDYLVGGSPLTATQDVDVFSERTTLIDVTRLEAHGLVLVLGRSGAAPGQQDCENAPC